MQRNGNQIPLPAQAALPDTRCEGTLGVVMRQGTASSLASPGACRGGSWRCVPQLDAPTSSRSRENLLQSAETAPGKPNEGTGIRQGWGAGASELFFFLMVAITCSTPLPHQARGRGGLIPCCR